MTLRNPRALVFTFAFPLILIVLFSALNGNAEVDAYGQNIRFAQFYTPAIAIFSLVTACYTTLILGIATARDQGLLKRVRGTPLPMGIYLGSWVTGAMLDRHRRRAAAVRGRDPRLRRRHLREHAAGRARHPAARRGLPGLARRRGRLLVKSADQAMPVAQLTFLPISFISGIWFPLDGAPDWLVKVSHFFPLSHIVNAFGSCFHAAGSSSTAPTWSSIADLDGGRPVRGGAPLPLGAVELSALCRLS